MNNFTCDWIFNILVVLCDGKVVCGCADPYGQRPLGDLKEQSIKEIWNSWKVQTIRRQLNSGHSCFCEECGLKQMLPKGAEIPQNPPVMEVLPRIFLEPTVKCNLSCYKAVCNKESGIDKTRSRHFFPLEDFKKLMDEIGPELQRLDLFNYGDPFVHPRAVDMIEYVKKNYPHIYLYVSTNGLMLNREKMERLVESGLDEITFSVDGCNQKTYGAYRHPGSFEKVYSVMKEFSEIRDKKGREVPYINWRYIIFKWNDSFLSMNRARKLAEKSGVDRLTWEITNHPPDAESLKYRENTKAWKKIYYEIWDTSQTGNAIKNKQLKSIIRPENKSIIMNQSESFSADISVKNSGGALWRKSTYSGRRIIRLGGQLYTENKELINRDYARAFINRDMRGKESDIINITLPEIKTPGTYFLKFDMVSEGIDWFESGGSDVTWVKLTVK